MRIIDKNTDYYDYLQNYDDPLVFDRRGSYLLTKEKFCSNLQSSYRYHDGKEFKTNEEEFYRFVLFQCGATFWLILVHITDHDESRPIAYELELLSSWKNYNVSRKVLKLSEIEFWFETIVRSKKYKTPHDYIKSNVDRMVDAINTNHLYQIRSMKGETVSRFKKFDIINEERTIPILSACGIANIIDPVDIFIALEEHFSLLKTESERIDPIGATNDDKIVMHGFDTKTSFRNKK